MKIANAEPSLYWSEEGHVAGVDYTSRRRPRWKSAPDGKAEKEREHTIYARVADFAFLEKASSMESQEQWEIRIEKTEGNYVKGSLRVRKTWVEGADPVYTRVTKIPRKEADSKIETALPSNEEEFLSFMAMASLGMRKDRYHFPVLGTDLVWKFDVFPQG